MDVLTPFEFIDRYDEGKTVAIVGNAPTLANTGLGKWIDSHDIVVRFNDCRVNGYERDVGSRTSILVCNPYAETRPDRKVGDAVSPETVVAISSLTRRGDMAEFSRWVGRFPTMFTYSPDIRIDCGDRSKVALTTGTYGLVLMSKLLKPSALFVTGFTMFQPGTDFHYWSDITPSGLKAHTPKKEAEIFSRILNGLNIPIFVTRDIMGVFETANTTPSSKITQKKSQI
ncbi:glycosyltransferase family 29 protein [Ruegeria arenilitoris]|uniref:glycosyltransferase family 29 protein n=1 Tax=Ruegeria arenilitoris TaxID=1173585 RepID=UPI001481BA85|nr:glycosyltransferase family 29 protein [Ruegeria arenilitoris]